MNLGKLVEWLKPRKQPIMGKRAYAPTNGTSLSTDGEERAELVKTSVTLSYQDERWGVERIALDGIQNHLPSDSQGTRVDIDFLVDTQWVPRSRYQQGTVEAIRFSDDGIGYSYELLGLFHSKKKGDEEAVGYFGEGLKMVSAACAREGVDLELRSRDWQARPRIIPVDIDDEHIQQLAYEVRDAEKIRGSQTVFLHPTHELVEYVRGLERKVLPLRHDFKPVYAKGKRAIVDSAGAIFVRGVFISTTFADRLMFSYNLDVVPNRDRDTISERSLTNELHTVWSECRDTEPIKAFIETAQQEPRRFADSHEAYVLNRWTNTFPAESWRKAFEELYGENAVIQTRENLQQLVENLGYRVVKVNDPHLAKNLRQFGIREDIETLDKNDVYLYESESFDPAAIRKEVAFTSVTLDYRAQKWSDLRIVLDIIANHMPSDSGATGIRVEYLHAYTDEEGHEKKRWSE